MYVKDYLKDPYSKQAQKLGYRCRAALKLIEIDNKFKIFKPNMNILDLGAAPGGWCQVAKNILKKKKSDGGCVIGVDILPIEPIHNVTLIQKDINEIEIETFEKKFDLIMSDICANKTGNKTVDDVSILNLTTMALNCAQKVLNQDGIFICKFFDGGTIKEFRDNLNSIFNKCQIFKPKSSRDVSSEVYFYCKGLKK